MSISNADQADFWNSEPGQNWVKFAADLDEIHRNVTDLLLEASEATDGERIADIGCGAGASTFALAVRAGPSGHVTGIDVSAPLLQLAKDRKANLNIPNTSFKLADAQDHVFPPEEFDLVASRFGLMFFADPVAAFRNLFGTTRRGGRIAFVAWAGPDRNPWFRLPQAIAIDHLGPVPSVPPEAPGPMAFRDIDRVVGILEAAGFSDCQGQCVATNLYHPGGLNAVIRLASHVGPTARIVRTKGGSAEDHAMIMKRVADALTEFDRPDGIRIPAGINVFRARRH
ncbi:MAG: class I SAM-dependent methyltransferase [Paracoccaceae bacterium]